MGSMAPIIFWIIFQRISSNLFRWPKTATFLKKADAVTWAQETETKVKQSKYFPNRLIESEKYTLTDLLNRYKSDVLPRKRDKKQIGLIEWWKVQIGNYKLKDLTPSLVT